MSLRGTGQWGGGGGRVKKWGGGGLDSSRSQFLKVNTRYVDLIGGSKSNTTLLNTFFKILSRFLRK
jgi:hypothetical protein